MTDSKDFPPDVLPDSRSRVPLPNRDDLDEAARVVYDAHVKIDPAAGKSLAGLYQENSEAALAHAEFEFICERDRTDADPYNRLGVLIAESGDHKSAVEKLTIAANLAPTDPGIRINLANVLALNFDVDQVTSLYE